MVPGVLVGGVGGDKAGTNPEGMCLTEIHPHLKPPRLTPPRGSGQLYLLIFGLVLTALASRARSSLAVQQPVGHHASAPLSVSQWS